MPIIDDFKEMPFSQVGRSATTRWTAAGLHHGAWMKALPDAASTL